MSSPVVPLALAGAALFLLSGKGKSKSGSSTASGISYKKPSGLKVPDIYGAMATTAPNTSDSSVDWRKRQEALYAISQISFIVEGREVWLCSKCDPKGVDGKTGSNTRKAIKAFQALAGITPTGSWTSREDEAMFMVLNSIFSGKPIPCDPFVSYPAPLACIAQPDGGHVLQPQIQHEPTPSEPSTVPDPTEPPSGSQYGPDELLVTDGDCNYIEHQDDAFFGEQNRVIIQYALDGMTDGIAAEGIHEEMMSRYIPMCLFLGKDNVGPGVLNWWNTNLSHVASKLKSYDLLPELLEEDAAKYGLS